MQKVSLLNSLMNGAEMNVGSKWAYFVSSVSLYIYHRGWDLVNIGEDLLFLRKGGGMLDKIEELIG